MDPTSNGTLEDFPAELHDQATLALDAERQSIEKGIDAWKKLVGSAPSRLGAPARAGPALQASRALEGLRGDPEGSRGQGRLAEPDAKVPLLLEMADIYRERLKLDVNVIDSYNRILAIQPGNVDGDGCADRAARSAAPIHAGRTSSRSCARRPRLTAAPEEKVALQLRVANLYIEKFQNQAEAIKCFEAILEIDPANGEAITYLKQMYEKRRDWERLLGVLRQEVARIADPAEQARRWAEVAKLATEKLKKAPVSIELWSKVLELADSDARGLGRAGEALRAREALGGPGGDPAQAGRPGRRSGQARGPAAQAGHSLHREAAEARPGHRGLEGPARDRARQPPRPGRPAQAVPAEQGLGRARGLLLDPEQVGRVRARAGAAERNPRTTPRASACGTRSRRSTRSAWASPTRRRRRSRRPSRSTRPTWSPAEP